MADTDNFNLDSIIQGCLKKQEQAQEALYKMYFGYALSVALLYSASRNDAMETVDDSFIKIFSDIKKYDKKKSFKAWLRKIVINTSLDKFRKNKRRYLLSTDDIPEIADHGSNISDHLAYGDIKVLFEVLPHIYKTVFSLYEIEGYSHREIAKRLRISESSSRVYLTRAKRELRDLYEKYFN